MPSVQDKQQGASTDRAEALELQVEHLHDGRGWHRHKEHVKQMPPENIAREVDFNNAHLPREYR